MRYLTLTSLLLLAGLAVDSEPIDPAVEAVLEKHYPDREALTEYQLAGEAEPLPAFSALVYDDDLDIAQRAFAREAAARIGLEFLWIEGTAVVVPYRNGAAAKAGLRRAMALVDVNGLPVGSAGDIRRILARIGDDSQSINLRLSDFAKDAVEQIRVPLPPKEDPRAIEVVRLSTDTLLLRIFGFDNSSVPNAVREAVTSRAWSHVILDLRYSAGGSVAGATRVAGLFLGPDKLVADLDQKVPGWGQTLTTADEGVVIDARLTLLIGPWTYSASEIFAQAIGGWNRGALIGQRTRGKCLLQRLYPASDGLKVLIPAATATFGPRHCQAPPEKLGGVVPTVEIPFDQLHNDDWMWQHGVLLADQGIFACFSKDLASKEEQIASDLLRANISALDPRLLGTGVHIIDVFRRDSVDLCIGPLSSFERAKEMTNRLSAHWDLPFAAIFLDPTGRSSPEAVE